MEGWDANSDGTPSDLTRRRWENFGRSGAKLIWGGEAAAVTPDGRANPRQTLATSNNVTGLCELREVLLQSHRSACGNDNQLVIGLQLTHSGRFSRPTLAGPAPRIAYHHPLLDKKFGIAPDDNSVVWTDDELERLCDDYVAAARRAAAAGFQFVDIKACHGYLLHEFLSARPRSGRFGGDFPGRTRLLKQIIRRIHSELPDLDVAVRLSVFDTLPYQTSREIGKPMEYDASAPYTYGFGVDEHAPLQIDLAEPIQLIRELKDLGVVAINVTCGSPYYNPHIQRPAIFPPSDGYHPPEDPLVGVARQIHATRACKEAVPEMPFVGTGYSYLQEYLVPVAQAVVRAGWVDFVGIGRGVLSYPSLPLDTLQHGSLQRKLLCRTFSDCTTAPRHGLVSGCYPLDTFYKQLPECDKILEIKQSLRSDEEP
jgi:2,4-dienoyl-CoA reductase-like NADH-dependent reductase (Old Yellow Enzyme family)